MFQIFKKTPPPTPLVELTIEKILEKTQYNYRLSHQDTAYVLEKCTDIKQYARLYRNAFVANRYPDLEIHNFVGYHTLDMIHRETLKELVKVLPGLTLSEIKTIYALFDTTWQSKDNSKGRLMIMSILEVRWREMVLEKFNKLKDSSKSSHLDYQFLYEECKEDDPNILEIAKEIIRLSATP